MADVVLLRTLTRKSTMKFGKYYDLTVQMILDSQGVRGLSWLCWVYYNADMINFMPDILEELGVYDDLRISKHGKVLIKEDRKRLEKKAMCNRIDEEGGLSGDEKSKLAGFRRKVSYSQDKIKKRKENSIDKLLFSKNNLAKRNHGKRIN